MSNSSIDKDENKVGLKILILIATVTLGLSSCATTPHDNDPPGWYHMEMMQRMADRPDMERRHK